MAPLTTVSELRALLRWGNVSENAPMPGWRVFALSPSAESLASIEFVFDDQVAMLHQLNFGPWHGHYTESMDERRNLRRAVATARALVAGSRCLLVQRAADGVYLGSGIYRRALLPVSLSPNFHHLERLVFDASPERVPIDMTGYHRTKSGSYIEQAWRRRLKAAFESTDVDTAMFD